MCDKDALEGFRPRTTDAILDFVELIQVHHDKLMQPVLAHPESPLKAWCSSWLAEVELFREIRRIEKNEESAENKVRNIIDLLETMDPDFIPTDRPIDERLHRYLEHISLDRDNEDSEEGRDMVTLITMHSCKGLEYPYVYIAGVEDGLIPHSRSKVEGNLDEERRLFYVAITRAKLALTMSHCEYRKKYGEQICAWIKLVEGETAAVDEIISFCDGQIAHQKVPRYVRFVDEFPMTVTGKIQKFVMREQMEADLGLTTVKTA